MRRSQCRVRPQLVLELEYPKPQALLEESPKGLVEALADLLLVAAGKERATVRGGADELQDHA
jgi:hypothetical protein